MTTVNFTKPVTSDLRADVLAYIRDYMAGQAKLFDGDTLVSLPTGTVRYNSGNTRFEIWNGATWGVLNISGQGSFLPLTGGELSGEIAVRASPSTGYVQIKSGDVTGSGYIDFRNAANDRTGYIGYASSGFNNLIAGSGFGWYTTGTWRHGPNSAIQFVNEAEAAQWSIGAHGAGSNDNLLFYNIPATRSVFTISPWNDAVAIGNFSPSVWPEGTHRGLEVGNTGNGFACTTAADGQQFFMVGNAVWNGTNVVHARTALAWFLDISNGGIGMTYSESKAAGSTVSGIVTWNVTNQGHASFYGSVLTGGLAGHGQVNLISGGVTNPGYVEFRTPDGTRRGYVGWTNGSNIELRAENGRTFLVSGATTWTTNGWVSGLEMSAGHAIRWRLSGGYSWGIGNSGANLYFGTSTVDDASAGISSYWLTVAGSSSWCTFSGGADFGSSVNAAGLRSGNGSSGEKTVILWNVNRYVYYYLSADGSTTGLWDSSGGFNRWTSDSAGNFVAYGNVTAYSDERLKSDFFSARVSLEQMLLVEPEGFRRIDTGMWQVGVRAQALQKIMPLSVLKGSDGYLTVNYGAAAMVLALSLAREVAELKEELHGKNRRRH